MKTPSLPCRWSRAFAGIAALLSPRHVTVLAGCLTLLVAVPVAAAAPIVQQAYLKASNTGANDSFGSAVAISGDTMVIGAAGESSSATGVNGNQEDDNMPSAGAAYVFVRNGSTWVQQAYLKSSNTEVDDFFGAAVAISGDTIVIGAWGEDSSAVGVDGSQNNNDALNSGAVYVFVRNGTTWTQQAYLKASNTGIDDRFGVSVAISGNTLVIGAYGEDSNATGVNGIQSDNSAPDSGAAYVFVRSGTVWTQQAYLKASNTATDDGFGAVSISGDTIVVGATGEDSSATGVNGNQSDNSVPYAGAAYVFTRTGTNWSQQAYLKPSNTQENGAFGSVNLDGDTLVVGAPFESSGVSGNPADTNAPYAGAAYVFVRNGTTWTQQAYLKASNPHAGDNFGDSLGLSGDTIVIGARNEAGAAKGVNGNQNDVSAPNAGAAYLFTRSGTNWTQQAYLKGSNTERDDYFGIAVSVSGNTVLVGAVAEGSGAVGVGGGQCFNGAINSGAAYAFALNGIAAPGVPEIAMEFPFITELTSGLSIVDFYAVVTKSQQIELLVRNDGDAPLSIIGITITETNASDFSLLSQPAGMLGPCAKSPFIVRFAPSAAGFRTAVLHVASNDADESPFDIHLLGQGVEPIAEISVETDTNLTDGVSSVDFGTKLLGGSAGRTFIIRNSGNVDLTGLGITFDGPHASDFTLTTAPTPPVWGGTAGLPGGSTNFVVTFRPGAAGARTAALHLHSNDTGESPFDITLTGTGVTPLQAAQEAYLKASNTGTADLFDWSVAISRDTIVVGAPREDSNATGVNGNSNNNSATDSGAAYVFVRNGATWTQQAYLKASNAEAQDLFGWAVAVSGDTVVVGASGEGSNAVGVNGNPSNNAAQSSGAAYVFERSGTNWTQQAYLKPSNTGAGDQFGFSVAISSNTIVVGALGEDSAATGVNGNQADDTASDAGAVYVFERTGTNWIQQAYLKASNTGSGDRFGLSAAVAGDTVVVGAPAEDSNARGINGSGTNNLALDSGAAYVFARTGTNWTQQAYLKASNTGQFDEFGVSVSVSGETVAVGAWFEDSAATGVNGGQTDGMTDSGAAHVFVRSGTNWTQEAYLKASNTGANDLFGRSVSLAGDSLVISAPQESSAATGPNGDDGNDGAYRSGAAYVFQRTWTNWSQRAYIKASNTESFDLFGHIVAISGSTLVVGAHWEDSSATGVNGNQNDNSAMDSGAGYVFALDPPPLIVTQPASQAVFIGSNAIFSVTAASTNPPLSYRWIFNGAELPGATNASLIISNTQIANLGNYQVVVSDKVSSVNSAVASLNLIDALFITSQPTGLAVRAGRTSPSPCPPMALVRSPMSGA